MSETKQHKLFTWDELGVERPDIGHTVITLNAEGIGFVEFKPANDEVGR